MRIKKNMPRFSFALAFLAALLMPVYAWAHCDSLDGPVIQDARHALDKRDATPILKWVQKKHESEIMAAFKQTLAVRAKGEDAKDLADRYFFETLVRIHREGESAPYTGLKPAHSVDPGIAEADKALETGSSRKLAKHMSSAINDGIQKRFDKALELKKHAAHNTEAGRAYVAAYVEYIHYIEKVHQLATQSTPHAHHESASHAGH